jgi:hypothetical protein
LRFSLVLLHINAFAVQALPCETFTIHAVSVVEVRAYIVLNWEVFILGAPVPKCVQNTVIAAKDLPFGQGRVSFGDVRQPYALSALPELSSPNCNSSVVPMNSCSFRIAVIYGRS